MKRITILAGTLALILLIGPGAHAQEFADIVKQGNEAYFNQQWSEALEKYQIAETQKPESPELNYNVAGVLFNQGKYEEAVEKYTRSLNSSEISLEAQAQYNLGNTHYRMGDFPNAIGSYENALNIDPTDLKAKFNLELARKMLKDQMKPEHQDQQEQQQQQQQQQQEEQQDDQEQQEQQQEPQQGDEEQQDQQQQQQQQQQEKPMSKEDAERILNALKDDEQDIQKKIRRTTAGGDYVGKDW